MRILFTLIAWMILGNVISQELLTGLQVNPVVRAKALELEKGNYLKSGNDTLPMVLPFFDDFSTSAVFPSSDRWIDRYAFVNTDFPLFPVNVGAATLDAINDTGNMYPEAIPGPAVFIADHLTSRYIRLDSVFSPVPRALTAADSIWFSFWYQPQGRGKPPQTNDSLVLQFLVIPAHDSITPDDTIAVPDQWETIWSTRGMPLDTFYINNNTYFKRVMVPVTDNQKFFKKTFRFRFFNYVSLASQAEPSWQGNCDQWNIDEVYLNLGRSWSDTIRPEIAFIERPPSLLKSYSSMPYPQYCDNPTNEIRDSIDVLMSNRDIADHNSSYRYTLSEPGGTFNETYDGGNYAMKPFYSFGYVTYIPFAHPPVPYLLPIESYDSASFLVQHIVEATDGSGFGDTITGWQRFFNYYAYDDGTPEAGYGLTPTGSMLAYRFTVSKPDTLRAVQIYFNRTLSKANQQFFYLRVWNDNNGKPGDQIYDTLVFVRFADSLNKFVTYPVFPPVKISGSFYVGMKQTTDDNLNIGFDRYNNSQNQILYNSDGQWYTSAYSGSLLMRPLVGKPFILGIHDPLQSERKIIVYPNPAKGSEIHVSVPGNDLGRGQFTAVVTDLSGRIVLNADPSGPVSIGGISSGIYILTLTERSGNVAGRCKFIVTR
jgi:hypothetical protein